jgi:hypothetical protein
MSTDLLNGPAIAQRLGVEGNYRKNGTFTMEFHDKQLDVRLVLVIDEEKRQVQLFIDRGKHRLPSYVGKVIVSDVDLVEYGPTNKMVTFVSRESLRQVTVWTNGHFSA